MSKLFIDGNDSNKEYDFRPYKRTRKPNTCKRYCNADTGVRLQEVSQLKKLGDQRSRECENCHEYTCTCLWRHLIDVIRNAKDHSTEDLDIITQAITSSITADCALGRHEKNVGDILLEEFRKSVKKYKNDMSLTDKKSLVWILKPIKHFRGSRTSLQLPDHKKASAQAKTKHTQRTKPYWEGAHVNKTAAEGANETTVRTAAHTPLHSYKSMSSDKGRTGRSHTKKAEKSHLTVSVPNTKKHHEKPATNERGGKQNISAKLRKIIDANCSVRRRVHKSRSLYSNMKYNSFSTDMEQTSRSRKWPSGDHAPTPYEKRNRSKAIDKSQYTRGKRKSDNLGESLSEAQTQTYAEYVNVKPVIQACGIETQTSIQSMLAGSRTSMEVQYHPSLSRFQDFNDGEDSDYCELSERVVSRDDIEIPVVKKENNLNPIVANKAQTSIELPWRTSGSAVQKLAANDPEDRADKLVTPRNGSKAFDAQIATTDRSKPRISPALSNIKAADRRANKPVCKRKSRIMQPNTQFSHSISTDNVPKPLRTFGIKTHTLSKSSDLIGHLNRESTPQTNAVTDGKPKDLRSVARTHTNKTESIYESPSEQGVSPTYQKTPLCVKLSNIHYTISFHTPVKL